MWAAGFVIGRNKGGATEIPTNSSRVRYRSREGCGFLDGPESAESQRTLTSFVWL